MLSKISVISWTVLFSFDLWHLDLWLYHKVACFDWVETMNYMYTALLHAFWAYLYAQWADIHQITDVLPLVEDNGQSHQVATIGHHCKLTNALGSGVGQPAFVCTVL